MNIFIGASHKGYANSIKPAGQVKQVNAGLNCFCGNDTYNGKSLTSLNGEKKSTLLEDMVSFLGRRSDHNEKNARKKRIKNNRKAKENRQYKSLHEFGGTPFITENGMRVSKNRVKPVEVKNDDDYVRPVYEYKNILKERLHSNINPNLKANLLAEGDIHDINRATTRVSSLSKYLKEYMVGFITPDGDHWFEKAMPFILKGCEAENIPEKEFHDVAEEFWGLLAKADNYWKSDSFVEYLGTLEQNPAVKATIKAVKDLQTESLKNVAFTGYPSKIKYIPELDFCAYSGRKLEWDSDELHRPSAEHILPHSVGGDEVNIDANYLITSAQANSIRGNMPLLEYLKGWDDREYDNYLESIKH